MNEAKKVAKEHISELEAELENSHCNLELAVASVREEFRRSHKQMMEENTHLQENLEQLKEDHAVEIQLLHKRLQESEELKGIVTGDCNRTRKSVRIEIIAYSSVI